VTGALIDAVALDTPGRMLINDPFAGGGVIPLAAAMRGHKVYAQELNQWAASGLATMFSLPDPERLRESIAALTQRVLPLVTGAYGTLMTDGSKGQVSHTFRVALADCTSCGTPQKLYPHALVTLLRRAERKLPEAFLACPNGHLFLSQRHGIAECPTCQAVTDPAASYTPRRLVECRNCGHAESLETRSKNGLKWEVVLVERAAHRKRELGIPTAGEIAAADADRWVPRRSLGEITAGQETRVLTRHGFKAWDDIYPRRQRVMVEELLALAEDCTDDPAVLAALRSAIIGSTEMAGLLSRWDRYYLKSYESMAGHRFNFTTLSVEPNVWGMPASGRGTTLRRLLRLVKASEWLQNETRKSALTTLGPTKSASQLDPAFADELSPADVMVVVGSSERQLLPTGSAHLVLTDPPYHDDVQYGELSRPLRAWAGLPSGDDVGDAVVNRSTQNLTEAGEYSSLLSRIFRESARTLREDGHLIFSYANRSPDAWIDLIEALHSAGLQAVGCEILHSENETDNAKRGVRACSLDLILDLVPKTNLSVEPYYPRGESSVEGDFLRIVAHYVLQIGNLKDGWKSDFRAEAGNAEFLAKI
jgi:hypothetical protein